MGDRTISIETQITIASSTSSRGEARTSMGTVSPIRSATAIMMGLWIGMTRRPEAKVSRLQISTGTVGLITSMATLMVMESPTSSNHAGGMILPHHRESIAMTTELTISVIPIISDRVPRRPIPIAMVPLTLKISIPMATAFPILMKHSTRTGMELSMFFRVDETMMGMGLTTLINNFRLILLV